MLVKKETAKELLSLTLNYAKNVAVAAHEYLSSHDKIRGYCKYPILTHFLPKDNPEYAKYYEQIPFLVHDIPMFELKDFPEDRIQYGAIFDGYSSDKLKIEDIEGFVDLHKFIVEDEELCKAFFEDDKSKHSKFYIRKIIKEIVERYLYGINATANLPEDIEEKLKPFVAEKLIRFIYDTLKIDICIPICLATFECEKAQLSDQAEIVRIPDDIQKARKQACIYESFNEDRIASCATHMIVLHGYNFENKEYFSVNTATRNYNAYPLQVIDEILAIIRVVTGYTIGYEQILSIPIGWIDSTFADLTPIYGAKAHCVNAKELTKFWMALPVSVVSKQQMESIQKLYSTATSLSATGPAEKFHFALRRFNRCLLRNENDDMTIDAMIGLEALLSGGTKGEITYTISNRIPIVFTHEHDNLYQAVDCRAIMKKIYNYRSRVVHGEVLKEKDIYHTIGTEKLSVEKISVDFLRQTLLFVLQYPKFLDSKEFDRYIDVVVSQHTPQRENQPKAQEKV